MMSTNISTAHPHESLFERPKHILTATSSKTNQFRSHVAKDGGRPQPESRVIDIGPKEIIPASGDVGTCILSQD